MSTKRPRHEAGEESMTQHRLAAQPTFLVGEAVFYVEEMSDVRVNRVWRDKVAMDLDVRHVFRDASQVCCEYTMRQGSDDVASKALVEQWDAHAWYEVIWYEYDEMRQIVPQAMLRPAKFHFPLAVGAAEVRRVTARGAVEVLPTCDAGTRGGREGPEDGA
jgi:hypothetical protein